MNDAAESQTLRPRGIALLLGLKCRIFRNHLHQVVLETPFKVASALGAVMLIWWGLYILFDMIFRMIREQTFEAIVAIPLMLDFFFVALMIMLIFSNGIIAYGGLFARREPAFLLSHPVLPSHLALLKFLESLLLSSWSLILIGLPLMAAMAAHTKYLPWYYYPLFVIFFTCFIPMPGAIGLFIAWSVGVWFSRIAKRVIVLAVILVVSVISLWFWNLWASRYNDDGTWLRDFFDRASLIQGTFWPSSWVSRGLSHVRDGDLQTGLFYLYIIVSNSLFFSWVAIKFVGRRFVLAYDRVQACGSKERYTGRLSQTVAGVLFWYLPADLRALSLKDLRTFLRDATQWSQLLILLGLLGLYVVNIPNVPMSLKAVDLQLLISFLNLAAISLILATFTSRFVFPLISLEVQQIWLIGLLPMPRGRLLIPKFAFALTVTLLSGFAVIALAALVSQISFELLVINIVPVISICLSLCGLAVGFGARFPMINERNPAKIANGIGGTINLLSSLIIVVAILALCFVIGLHFRQIGGPQIDQLSALLLGGVLSLGIIACVVPMWIGTRHFQRLQL